MSKFREVLCKRFAIVCFGNNKYFRCVTPVVAFACINACHCFSRVLENQCPLPNLKCGRKCILFSSLVVETTNPVVILLHWVDTLTLAYCLFVF